MPSPLRALAPTLRLFSRAILSYVDERGTTTALAERSNRADVPTCSTGLASPCSTSSRAAIRVRDHAPHSRPHHGRRSSSAVGHFGIGRRQPGWAPTVVDMRPREITVQASPALGMDETEALYREVGWTTYAVTLEAALAGSSRVVVARRDGRLVGLARVISDGATICYLQDVLVHPEAQRAGVGRALVLAALEPYASVRQKVLLTDDEPGQRAFSSPWVTRRPETTAQALCERSFASTTDRQARPARRFLRRCISRPEHTTPGVTSSAYQATGGKATSPASSLRPGRSPTS